VVGLAEVLLVLVLVLQVGQILVEVGLLYLGVACQGVLVVQILVGLLFLVVRAFLGLAVQSLVAGLLVLVLVLQVVQILVEEGQEVLLSYQEEDLLFQGGLQEVQGVLVLVVQSLVAGLLFLVVRAFLGQGVLCYQVEGLQASQAFQAFQGLRVVLYPCQEEGRI